MAIMMALGAKKSSVISCYATPTFLMIGLSALLSLPLAVGFIFLLNQGFERLFGLHSLLRLGEAGIDSRLWLSLGLMVMAFLIVSFLALAMAFRKLSLSKEMRDE